MSDRTLIPQGKHEEPTVRLRLEGRPSLARAAPEECGRLAPGEIVGSFTLDRFLARGGQGEVYAACHGRTGRAAAIKVMRRDCANEPWMVTRFLREVEVVNLLHHPDIVEILEMGSLEDGSPFYAMEYLDGVSLADLLTRRGRLPAEEALFILEPVCAALSAAHRAGIVHRDVKANNIFVLEGPPRRVKLLDFGIAKLLENPDRSASGLTSAGGFVGTIAIMAPEQILGRDIDRRIDIYALGILLYHMLTGRVPFSSSSRLDVLRQHIESPAPRPSDSLCVPTELDAVVLRCLEKEPVDRFHSVDEFTTALRAAVKGRAASEGGETQTRGVGLHVRIQVSAEGDHLDEPLAEDLGQILALGERALQEGGFIEISANEAELFGVRRLPPERAEALAAQGAALEQAMRLREALSLRPSPDPRIAVSLCVHVEEIVLGGAPALEVTGGALTETTRWLPEQNAPELLASQAAIPEDCGFDLEPAEGPWVVVRRRAPR